MLEGNYTVSFSLSISIDTRSIVRIVGANNIKFDSRTIMIDVLTTTYNTTNEEVNLNLITTNPELVIKVDYVPSPPTPPPSPPTHPPFSPSSPPSPASPPLSHTIYIKSGLSNFGISLNTNISLTSINNVIPNNTIIYDFPGSGTYLKINGQIDQGTLIPGRGYIIYTPSDFNIQITGSRFVDQKVEINKGFSNFALRGSDNVNLNSINFSENTTIYDFPQRRYIQIGNYMDDGVLEPFKGYLIKTSAPVDI